MVYERLIFRVHAVRRMFQRKISDQEVRQALVDGETIERYPDDTPYPSQLILGWVEGRPLHVVIACNAADQETIIITVYEPSLDKWEADFRRRRKQ